MNKKFLEIKEDLSSQLLGSSRLLFEPLSLKHISLDYVSWLNDPEVNHYLETRHIKQTSKMIQVYIENKIQSDSDILFAILYKDNGKHIGNIKLGDINQYHSSADISYLIGDKSYWNIGIGTEAVKRVCDYAFEELGLFHLRAGYYESNYSSAKVLSKAGFSVCGKFSKKLVAGTTREDHVFCQLVKQKEGLV